MNQLFLFVKHPYAAGIIAVFWVGSTILYAMDRELPIVMMVFINMSVTLIIVLLGFRGSTKT